MDGYYTCSNAWANRSTWWGIGFGYGAIGGVEFLLKTLVALSLPKGKNNVSDFIPVARIADMLNKPNTSYEFNGEKEFT